MKNTAKNPADYIVPLNMNGLIGRMVVLPPPRTRKREILFVYGHHSSLERWFGMALDLNQYGGVTMPDLPGFGGMESFYKLGEKATLDNYADYLAAFVKLKYKRKKVTLVGLSFGFLVITRMLQRYPDLSSIVELLTSVAGFAHRDDFRFSKPRLLLYKLMTRLGSWRLPAIWLRYAILNGPLLRLVYERRFKARQSKLLSKEDITALTDFEIYLWQTNDVRTWLKTTHEMLTVDNCKKQIKVPLCHVSVKSDPYFNTSIVEQHLRIIFSDFTEYKSTLTNHTPSVLASLEESAPAIPRQLRRVLAQR